MYFLIKNIIEIFIKINKEILLISSLNWEKNATEIIEN